MTDILYEHPLNERLRHYLKLEQLFQQATTSVANNVFQQYNMFFNSLFIILDSLDRGDIRGELIKELEKVEQCLVLWSKNPEIDQQALNQTLKDSVHFSCQLKDFNNVRIQFKENKLLTSIKQRYTLQASGCLFDLPQLTFLLNQPESSLIELCQQWLTLLAPINNAINLILKFIRQRADFETIETETGFYQESGEGLSLLRIKVHQDIHYYPTVSGNRFRYSIRFMEPCPTKGKTYANTKVAFKLARC